MAGRLKTTNEQKEARMTLGVLAGTTTGALFGLVAGTPLYAVTGEPAPLLLSCAVGAALGAVTGRVFMSSAVEETIAPGVSGRDYVGTHAPDAAEATPEPGAAKGTSGSRDADQPPKS